jgi:hypothetical protein
MQRSLNKYRFGLAIIALFTVVILVVVVMQASATRTDQQTENTANNIATTLNTYVSYSSSGFAPDSLSQAGVSNVPDTIRYTKTSNYSYQFCMTYKQASTDFSASGVADDIMTRGFGGGMGGGFNNQNSFNNLPDLEINPIHHKGINCQTVSLYNYNYNSSPTTSR